MATMIDKGDYTASGDFNDNALVGETEEERRKRLADERKLAIQREMDRLAAESELAALQIAKRPAPVSPPTAAVAPPTFFNPTTQGKGYIGPMISQPEFAALPQGVTSRAPLAQPSSLAPFTAPSPETDQAALARLRAADRPGTRTISVNSEPPGSEASLAAIAAQKKFDAMRQYQYLTSNGVPGPQALAQSGMDLFLPQTKTTPPKPIKLGTDGVAVIDQSGQLQVLRPPTPRTTTPPVLNAIESKQLSAAYAERARAVSDLRDPMKRMARPQIEQSLEDANRIISKYEARVSAPTNGAGPTQKDIDYLRNNPGKKALFEKRFGIGSADQYLK